MATPDKLLSTKNQDPTPKIKKNAEDQEPKDLGGPESDWTTDQYMNFSFDATNGVKADTSIPKKVAAEPMPKLKTVKEAAEDDEDKDELDEAMPNLNPGTTRLGEEDDDETEEVTSDDSGEEPKVEDEIDESESSTYLDLKDLADADTDLIQLGPAADEDGGTDAPADDDVKEEATDDEELPVDDDAELVDESGDDDNDDTNVDIHIDAGEAHEGDIEEEDAIPELKFDDEMDEESGDEESEESEETSDEDVEDVEESLKADPMPKLKKVAEEKDDDDDEAEEVEESVGAEPMPKLKKVAEAKKLGKGLKLFKAKKAAKGKKGKVTEAIKINLKLTESSKKLFAGNTTLTEEDKRQTKSLFEAAIRHAAKQIGTQIHETYQNRYTERVQMAEQKMATQVDRYLQYVVTEWVKENRSALKGQLTNKLTENFMRGLKSLFVEHYIDVPDSKVNVVEALAKNVKALRSQVREAEGRLVKMHTEMKASVRRERMALVNEHKARLIAEAATAVVASDRGEFKKRATSISFKESKSFKRDLVALREQYFGAKKPVERPVNVPDAAPLFEAKSHKRTSGIDAAVGVLDRLTGQQ